MNIPVKYTESVTPVNVVVNDQCNHHDFYEERESQEYFNGQEWVDTRIVATILICQCGAWKYEDDTDWNEA